MKLSAVLSLAGATFSAAEFPTSFLQSRPPASAGAPHLDYDRLITQAVDAISKSNLTARGGPLSLFVNPAIYDAESVARQKFELGVAQEKAFNQDQGWEGLFGFHGAKDLNSGLGFSREAYRNISASNFDPTRRTNQMYGPGEYGGNLTEEGFDRANYYASYSDALILFVAIGNINVGNNYDAQDVLVVNNPTYDTDSPALHGAPSLPMFMLPLGVVLRHSTASLDEKERAIRNEVFPGMKVQEIPIDKFVPESTVVTRESVLDNLKKSKPCSVAAAQEEIAKWTATIEEAAEDQLGAVRAAVLAEIAEVQAKVQNIVKFRKQYPSLTMTDQRDFKNCINHFAKLVEV